MQKVEPYFKAADQKYDVAKYAINETELPQKMTAAGFQDISIHFLVITAIPDSAMLSRSGKNHYRRKQTDSAGCR